MSDPRQRPDSSFWRRAVSPVEPHLLDPVVAPRFRIEPGEKVATAGSCFSQHIARQLQHLAIDYLVTEDGAELPPETRIAGQYGLFSARYGNIYTTAQFAQLLDEAFGRRPVQDAAWPGREGGWIDPLRPTVEPGGFADPAAVRADRLRHLSAVRRVIEQADVLFFTLGLTEAWRSRADGTVYPLAPGVAGGALDPDLHEFHNFTPAECEATLGAALAAARAVNPRLKVILTVSPVSMMATYEAAHVLTATVYTKSVLRVTAEAMRRRFDWVDYFPSYEVVVGPPTGGLYYKDDMREVNALGVARVMRLFEQHYVAGAAASPSGAPLPLPETTTTAGIICDEEMMDAARG